MLYCFRVAWRAATADLSIFPSSDIPACSCWATGTLHYANPDAVPHYKFGMEGHRDFLFFPPEAIGTTIPSDLSRRFPQTALNF
jgi:hypothetical protein